MKQLIRKLINKTGFDIVRTENSNDNLSKHLQNLLSNKSIDCVIDVGANTGQYGSFLRGIGYSGYIVSFEPVSSVFKILKENCEQDNKWFCYDFALGDKSEEKAINVYESTVFSSFLKANEYSKNIWSSLNNVEPESVNIRRLDEVFGETIASLGCAGHMLKLDTQGYDKLAFDGAKGCLDNILALQSELSLISVYEGMDDVYGILKDFHKGGFYISGMYPINRDESLAVIEYDCVLVKR